MLEIQNISKNYGQHTALKQINLKVPQGEIFGLLGPNGAGKTSLIRIINQIILPDSGQILFEGEKLQTKHISQIGYMPEERGLYKNMKVGEQALYLAQLKGMNKRDAKMVLQEWFERFEITHWWSKKLTDLSKGMAQKVQFIITVLHQPKLLIFDEPFSGFDPLNADIIKHEIIRLKKEGATIIFSTHRMESVEEICDKIALIDHAKLILTGAVRNIRKQFKNNNYRVHFETYDTEKLAHFKQLFTLKEEEQLSDSSIILILQNSSPLNILHEAQKVGHIIHYEEILPSMHEVFIQNVQV